MKKLIRVEQITFNKYLNMFYAFYETKNGEFRYEFASRKKLSDLACKNKNSKTDAVRVIPYLKKDDKIYVVLIKEFRYAINKTIYAVPAGLIDEDEQADLAVTRELEEEIGASVVKLKKTEPASYSSAGLSDESIICYEAEIKLDKEQKLEETEDIRLEIVPLEKLPELLNKKEFGIQSRLQLRSFYYKCKYEEIER